MAKKKIEAGETSTPAAGDKLEQIKQDLIARLKQREKDMPYIVRASGCTSTRDYLVGHINELKEILRLHFDYKEEE